MGKNTIRLVLSPWYQLMSIISVLLIYFINLGPNFTEGMRRSKENGSHRKKYSLNISVNPLGYNHCYFY